MEELRGAFAHYEEEDEWRALFVAIGFVSMADCGTFLKKQSPSSRTQANEIPVHQRPAGRVPGHSHV
ncbi:MAG: hypothetical protein V3S97_10655 [Candidatus Bathyarchaeia archaeon]